MIRRYIIWHDNHGYDERLRPPETPAVQITFALRACPGWHLLRRVLIPQTEPVAKRLRVRPR